MTVREFLAELQALDIRLTTNGDRLRCNAPVGALTPNLRGEIEQKKAEILAFLRASESAAARRSVVVPIRASGSRPPLFAVPGHNGDVFCYLPILRHLAPDQPVFALEPPGLDAGQTPVTTIPQLAARFVDAILEIRPEGPFLVAGYCLGGVTAFEVAALLRSRGHEVPVCALLRTNCPTVMWKRYAPLTVAQYAAAHIWQRVAGRSAGDIARMAFKKLFGKRPEPEAPPPPNESTERSLRLQEVTVAAFRSHVPSRFDGRVTICLPNSGAFSSLGRRRDWLKFASGGGDIVTGPRECTADTMLLEPHVGFFGAELQRTLDAALERRHSGG